MKVNDEKGRVDIVPGISCITPVELLDRLYASPNESDLGYSPAEVHQCLSFVAQSGAKNLFNEIVDAYMVHAQKTTDSMTGLRELAKGCEKIDSYSGLYVEGDPPGPTMKFFSDYVGLQKLHEEDTQCFESAPAHVFHEHRPSSSGSGEFCTPRYRISVGLDIRDVNGKKVHSDYREDCGIDLQVLNTSLEKILESSVTTTDGRTIQVNNFVNTPAYTDHDLTGFGSHYSSLTDTEIGQLSEHVRSFEKKWDLK